MFYIDDCYSPVFDDLDAIVANEFKEYLNEHGVDDEFASRIHSIAQNLENKRYIDWLKEVKEFASS